MPNPLKQNMALAGCPVGAPVIAVLYFGLKAMPNLEGIADNLPEKAWRKVLRPPRYEVQTEARKKPVNVNQRCYLNHPPD